MSLEIKPLLSDSEQSGKRVLLLDNMCVHVHCIVAGIIYAHIHMHTHARMHAAGTETTHILGNVSRQADNVLYTRYAVLENMYV